MSARLLASLPRLSPQRGGLLQGRVHQSLWLEMLVAATAASALMAITAGAVVLFHERSHLTGEAEEMQRQLSASLTSYEPLYNLQRRLQQAASGRQVEMAMVVSEQGRVLAASNNALLSQPIDRVLQLPAQKPLQALFRDCPTPRSLPGCLRQDSRLFLGPLPWIGGTMVLNMRQYPLAMEGMAGFGDRGTLITVHDAHEAGLEALSLSLSVFLASLLPLMLSYAGLMLRLRSRLIPELLALAELDALSGVYNRRAFLETAEELLRQAETAGLPMALAVIDIDRFKAINDSRGHDAGDRVIERVSELLRAAVRGTDLVGRLGGDEFVILLQLSGEAATQTLGRILETLRRTPIAVAGAQPVRVTLSVGVATREAEGHTTLADLLADADVALYLAKERGRDQVVNLERQGRQSLTPTQPPGAVNLPGI